MNFQSQKLLGLAAVAIGITGIVGMGIYEVATSCDQKSEAQSATYASADGDSKSSSCASRSSWTAKALASLEDKSESSSCASKGEYSAFAAFAAATGDLYSCEGEKSASAALASSDGASCSHGKKSASSSASLTSSEGSSCSYSKSASYASAAKNGSCSAANASACAEYNACSVKADLALAKGETLEFYQKEKAMDGEAISDFRLPMFTATDIEGNKVSSADLIGQPTVLVLLASHCGHSYKSLPILEQAAAKYGDKGLRVVGLMVVSNAKNTRAWFDSEEVNHEVWFTKDASVADALKSHLVPTYVLVDADGYVRAKLVGFKKGEEVTQSIPPLLVQAESGQDNQEG